MNRPALANTASLTHAALCAAAADACVAGLDAARPARWWTHGRPGHDAAVAVVMRLLDHHGLGVAPHDDVAVDARVEGVPVQVAITGLGPRPRRAAASGPVVVLSARLVDGGPRFWLGGGGRVSPRARHRPGLTLAAVARRLAQRGAARVFGGVG